MEKKEMDFAMERAILCEAEKLTDKFIQVICKISPIGLMFAVAFMNDNGMPIDRLTAWYSSPTRLLNSIRQQNEHRAESETMY